MDALEAKGLLYPCFCSRAELMTIAGAPHGLESEGPVYPGSCRELSPEERVARETAKTPSFRFALPEREVRFVDLAAGPQQFAAGAGGDFAVKRADGIFGYQLAVVVDDAAMGITDVLRGADLLDSTPRQLLLFEALGLRPPRFAHVPLLYGPDGRRLSKRHGSVTLSGMRRAGTAPQRVVGWLAFWSGLTDRPKPIEAAELVAGFRLDRVPKEPVVVSEAALRELAGG